MKKIMIRRLGVASVAKYVGIAQAILGAVYGFFAMFGGIAAVIVTEDLSVLSKIIASVGVVILAIGILPFIMFLVGWLYGAVFAFIANFILHTSSGIELDYEDAK